MSIIISNLELAYTYHKDISIAVGRSFLYSTAAQYILSQGAVAPALMTGASCASMTFVASLLSPVVAGLFGYYTGEEITGFNRVAIDAVIIILAAVILQVAFGIFTNPYVLVISLAISVFMASRKSLAGHTYTLMHPLGAFVSSYANRRL